MPKFKAADAVEPLDYEFAPYADVKGTVPEPSGDQVAAFYANLGKQLETALGDDRTEGVDMTSPTEVGRLFMSLTADDHKAMYDALLDLHAEVCSQQPSRDDLAQLPFRLRQAFYGAVQEWLRPEASRPATSS